jgi:hypothetical protein
MMKFDKLLKNKYLHYAAVALMVINVLGYVAMGSIECILVLGGAAYLAQHFTKNRTADIFIGLFVANILFGCGRLREGMNHDGPADSMKKAAADAHTKAKEHSANGEHDKAATMAKAAAVVSNTAEVAKKCAEGKKMGADGKCV